LPIPLKIKFSYENYSFKLYVYRFRINLHKLLCKARNASKVKKSPAKEKVSKTMSLENVRYLMHEFNNLKFKPKLKFKLQLSYGLYDAAYTAVAFGYLHTFLSSLYNLFSIAFKIKRYKIDINPEYNKLKLETSIESIFSINIAKLIYILIKMFKAYKTLNKTSKN
jgi:hypothetical protein